MCVRDVESERKRTVPSSLDRFCFPAFGVGWGGAAFATEIDDMQPLVVVASPTYIHAKCSTGGSKWLCRQIQ